MELYQYLNNNRDGLLPYNKRGITIPEPKEGILYKGMGIQETQNCTIITLRMKHRRMRWSVNGANNLAKALYRKENKELVKTIERYTDELVFTKQMQGEHLDIRKNAKKIGLFSEKKNTKISFLNNSWKVANDHLTQTTLDVRLTYCYLEFIIRENGIYL